MIEGTTKSGFKYKYDERIKKDYELLEAAADFDRAENLMTKCTALDDLMSKLLGDNKEALKKHVKDNNDGYCDSDVLVAEVFEIMKGPDDLKNSLSSLE